ncbi:MAG: glycosyltransferase [Phycisphaerae bacterium]
MSKPSAETRMVSGGVIGGPGYVGLPKRMSDVDSGGTLSRGHVASHSRSTSTPLLSIVVPVFNESEHIAQTYRSLAEAVSGLKGVAEFVFVDDGSTDSTGDLLIELSSRDPRVYVIQLLQNAGQHQATLVGIDAADGDVVMTLDADMMPGRELMTRIMETFDHHPECQAISVARNIRSSFGFRSFASRAVTWVTNSVCSSRLQDPGSTFKAVRRPIADLARQHDVLAQFFPMFVASSTRHIIEIPGTVDQVDRPSRYKLSTLVMTLMLAMLNYSRGATILTWTLSIAAFVSGLSALVLVLVPIFMMLAGWQVALGSAVFGIVGIMAGSYGLIMTTIGYKLEAFIRNSRLRQIPMRRYVRHGEVVSPAPPSTGYVAHRSDTTAGTTPSASAPATAAEAASLLPSSHAGIKRTDMTGVSPSKTTGLHP